ncbi:hypothetical protein [Maricaulis sp.]|uniref:hypothetical protein n=1 Tax=Maricaulis sp. TaxID=1486257 RepID=UPI00263179C4|nr:hypothetical protein [Maricaulis sp.]
MKPIAAIITALAVALSAGAETPKAPACAEGQAVSFEDLAAAHKAILYGDYHGTREMPAVFADAVAQAAAGERRVLVALEYPPEWQADLDAVMAALDELAALDAFSMHHTKDGRTSDAMRNMLLQLRALKLAGADIHVVAADSRRYRTDEDRAAVSALDLPDSVDRTLSVWDLDLALHTKAACEAVDCDLILMFAGNYHTGLATRPSQVIDPMTGEATSNRAATAGFVLNKFTPVASVMLVHRGGMAHNRVAGKLAIREELATAPDFMEEDGVYYCTGPHSFTHMFSVGLVFPSEDTLAPAPESQ